MRGNGYIYFNKKLGGCRFGENQKGKGEASLL
jgi:hypothetical protein